MTVHSNVNYKEWAKQLKNKQVANKNNHKSMKESDEKQKEFDEDNDDNHINSQILILGQSDHQNSTHHHHHRHHTHHHKHEASMESHSSLFTEPKVSSKDNNENKPALKRFLSEPNLSQSIHNLHVQKLKEFEPSSMNNKSTNMSKHKLDVISCQVVIFHNAHKLSKAMQSMIVQIMKMKQVPTSEHGIHQRLSAQNQVCIITRQTNKNLPFLMRDLCCFHYCVPSKKSLKKLHKFVKYEMSENDFSNSSSFDEPYLFNIARLNALYNAVEKVFIHNSMAQYIRDIIVAIRLHPDVKNGCSSFRSNEAMLIGAKFTNFMSRLNERCNGLKHINSAGIDLLIERIHFVRPKDVDNIAMQILSHRIDIIANEYSPSLSSEIVRNEREEYEDVNEQNVQKKEEKAEALKQLRLDILKGTKQRGSTYRTGSMSLPRTPRQDKERLMTKKKVKIKEEEQRNNDEIDFDDFEFELFSDSDDYDFMDEDEEFYDEEDDEYGDDGHGYDDNDEYAQEEYDEYLDGDHNHNMESHLDYHTNQSSKRNSDNVTGYSLLSEVNEKRLCAEQRLVYTLLRKVLLPPK